MRRRRLRVDREGFEGGGVKCGRGWPVIGQGVRRKTFLLVGVVLLAALLVGLFSGVALAASPGQPAGAYPGFSSASAKALGSPAVKDRLAGLFAQKSGLRAAPKALQAAAGTGSISGKVTNSGGTALANVDVLVLNSDLEIVNQNEILTASNGTYSVTGLPNIPVVVVTYNEFNYIDEWYSNDPVATDPDGSGATVLNLASTASRTGINFILDRGHSISGTVTASGGGGISDVFVDAVDLSGNYVNSGYTDDSGAYTISGLPAGQYKISTDASGAAESWVDEWYNNDPILLDFDGENAAVIDVRSSNASGKDFELAAGRSISGRVTGDSANGLEGVEVMLQSVATKQWVYQVTDDTGAYSIGGLLPGQYLLATANDQGYIDEWYQNEPVPGDLSGKNATAIDATAADATGIDFALDPGYTISGTVTDNVTHGALADPGMMVVIYNASGAIFSENFVGGSPDATTYTTWALPGGTTYYAAVADYTGADYAEEWYDNVKAALYDHTFATAIPVGTADVTGIDFGLDKLNEYDQTDGHIVWAGSHTTFTPSAPSYGGSYERLSATGSSATIWFTGTRLDWIAMKGSTTGPAKVYVDGSTTPETVDLTATSAKYQVNVWSTGYLSTRGLHKVEIDWNAGSGKFVTLDAIKIDGVIASAPPVITAVTPKTGSTLGGDSVVITGQNLTGATKVAFGAIDAAHFTVNSATQITATTPVEAAGTVQVQVTTAAGATADTAADDFTFAAPGTPTITSLSPTTGSVDGGTTVTITGTDFTGLTGDSAVTFDGVNAASYHVVSPTQITAVSPAHDAGTVRVEVTAAGGSTADTTNDDFTYTTAPPVTTYDQAGNKNIVKTGTWSDYAKPGLAYGDSYGRSNTKGATATVWFVGTQIDWIATEGTTTGTADVYLDGVKVKSVSLYASPAKYQVAAYSSPTLADGLHSLKIVNTSTKYLTLDAFAIAGSIAPPLTLYQQTDTRIKTTGIWTKYTKSAASGGSYGRSSTSEASVTITFTGVRLDWIAMTGTTTGFAYVYLDGATTPTATIDLHASAAKYQVMVWSTDLLSDGTHTVKIVRDDTDSAAGQFITIDALNVWGTLQ
jgi:hypothetical protein